VQRELGDTLAAHGFVLNPQKPGDAIDEPPYALFDATVSDFRVRYPDARLNFDAVDSVTIRVTLRDTLVVELENFPLAQATLPGDGSSPERRAAAFGLLRRELAEVLPSLATFPPRQPG